MGQSSSAHCSRRLGRDGWGWMKGEVGRRLLPCPSPDVVLCLCALCICLGTECKERPEGFSQDRGDRMMPSLCTLMTSRSTGLGHSLNSAHAASEPMQHTAPSAPGAVLSGERPRASFLVQRCPHTCRRRRGLSRVTPSYPREGCHCLFRDFTVLCTKGHQPCTSRVP